jgi:hypothetical protein
MTDPRSREPEGSDGAGPGGPPRRLPPTGMIGMGFFPDEVGLAPEWPDPAPQAPPPS